MWLEIDVDNFSVEQKGFAKTSNASTDLYISPGLSNITSASDLVAAEYGIAIEIDRKNRTVVFGRDYLGQYPLLTILRKQKLFLTDDIQHIDKWVSKQNIQLTLSEESMALYFSLGYVPQGMTLFDEVTSCKNATLYEYKNGRITECSTFKEIEISESSTIFDVDNAISHEVNQLTNKYPHFNIWCSGGIDSSIMAHCFSNKKTSSDLLTLGYDKKIQSIFGSGESHFAHVMANHCNARLKFAVLSSSNFLTIHDQSSKGHISPVIDTCILAKYALAKETENIAITGEGGDPVFGGVKIASVLFANAQLPHANIGRIYAAAHRRFFNRLDELFIHGKELTDYVIETLEKKIQSYPGNLTRKLFYYDTFEKQGGMIFPQSYYPSKRNSISLFHPLTHLSVYQSAFKLTDDKRFSYPNGKLVLQNLFRHRLPAEIIDRKKSGTIIPINSYIETLPNTYFNLDNFKSTNFFNDHFIDQLTNEHSEEPKLFLYGLITLNNWLLNRRRKTNERSLSLSNHHLREQRLY